MSGLPGAGRLAGSPPAGPSCIQQFLWAERRAGRGAAAAARALRLSGSIDAARLAAAVGDVVSGLEILRTAVAADAPVLITHRSGAPLHQASVAGTTPAERDQLCAEILCRDRDAMTGAALSPLPRFHLLECGGTETVLGVVADPIILDLRSAYLVLGAVMQAYFGRFRAAQYPPFDPGSGVSAQSRQGRLGWWSRHLRHWAQAGGQDQPGRPAESRTSGLRSTELVLSGERWAQLCQAASGGGNAGALAVIALLAWWLHTRAPRPRQPVFGSTLDLRDYAGLGPVVGPLTDRIVFGLDTDGLDRLTFADLVFRAHTGLLDAVVHYVPYQDIIDLGVRDGLLQPARAARYWDVAIHYCRTPPASAYTRGEETLARRGLSIELFCESVLAAAGADTPGGGDGMAMEIQLAESGTGMALVVNFDPLAVRGDEVAAMLAGLDAAADAVIADPQIPVTSL
jgi:hypothetical protein